MASDITGLATVAELGVIAAYILSKQPSDFVIAKQNSSASWYSPTDAIMTTLVPSLQIVDPDFTTAAAASDVSTMAAALFADNVQQLPQVYNPQCVANGYNSTTASMLTQNAFAEVTQKAIQLGLDTKLKYRGIRTNDLQAMVAIINAIKGSYGVVSVSQSAMGASVQQVVDAGFKLASQAITPGGGGPLGGLLAAIGL